jgi:hypothetical protein
MVKIGWTCETVEIIRLFSLEGLASAEGSNLNSIVSKRVRYEPGSAMHVAAERKRRFRSPRMEG